MDPNILAMGNRQLSKPAMASTEECRGEGEMQTKGQNLPLLRPAAAAQKQPAELDELRVATYNIWFDSLALAERTAAIVDILRTREAHVICLQEVTLRALQIILKDDWVVSNCFVVDPECTSFSCPYGVLILSTVPVIRAAYWPFKNSRMGRGLMEADFVIGAGKHACVGTVHLESLAAPRARKAQLQFSAAVVQAAAAAAGAGVAALCGDFNFDATRNFVEGAGPLENDTLGELPAWCDAWAALRPGEEGYTFDTQRNTMLAHMGKERMRYDRIVTLGKGPASIELLGDAPIIAPTSSLHYPIHIVYDATAAKRAAEAATAQSSADDELDRTPVFPSDHFGLLASFPLP